MKEIQQSISGVQGISSNIPNTTAQNVSFTPHKDNENMKEIDHEAWNTTKDSLIAFKKEEQKKVTFDASQSKKDFENDNSEKVSHKRHFYMAELKRNSVSSVPDRPDNQKVFQFHDKNGQKAKNSIVNSFMDEEKQNREKKDLMNKDSGKTHGKKTDYDIGTTLRNEKVRVRTRAIDYIFTIIFVFGAFLIEVTSTIMMTAFSAFRDNPFIGK